MTDDRCVCGLSYGALRTGLSYGEVYTILYLESVEARDRGGFYPPSTRARVLGRWRQLKLEQWDGHRERCGEAYARADEWADQLDEVPF